MANGVIYVGSDSGSIYALNSDTGAKLWSFTTGGAVESSRAVANGVIYVGSDDGKLYAFALRGSPAPITRPAAEQLHPNYALQPQNDKKS